MITIKHIQMNRRDMIGTGVSRLLLLPSLLKLWHNFSTTKTNANISENLSENLKSNHGKQLYCFHHALN